MRSVTALLIFMTVFASERLLAQTQSEAPIHWAYSAYFGTGRYRLAAEEEVYTASIRPRKRWRDAAIAPDGTRSFGIELDAPIGVGAHRFDANALGETFRFSNVGTISAVPGVEIEFPINDRWSVKPLAYGGWGTELNGDASAWIYWAGAKSRWKFSADSFEWSMINALTYVGYASNPGSRGSVLPLLTGFEFERPLAQKKIADQPVHLHWHVAYTKYLNEIEFTSVGLPGQPVDVTDEWELGMAFSTGEHPLRLWRLRWDRVGIAYRFSNDGNFKGIGLVFHSLFDR